MIDRSWDFLFGLMSDDDKAELFALIEADMVRLYDGEPLDGDDDLDDLPF